MKKNQPINTERHVCALVLATVQHPCGLKRCFTNLYGLKVHLETGGVQRFSFAWDKPLTTGAVHTDHARMYRKLQNLLNRVFYR